jgi:hypothetical protein
MPLVKPKLAVPNPPNICGGNSHPNIKAFIFNYEL